MADNTCRSCDKEHPLGRRCWFKADWLTPAQAAATQQTELEKIEAAFQGWSVTRIDFDPDCSEGGLRFWLSDRRQFPKRKTVTLGYTELGEWLESEKELP